MRSVEIAFKNIAFCTCLVGLLVVSLLAIARFAASVFSKVMYGIGRKGYFRKSYQFIKALFLLLGCGIATYVAGTKSGTGEAGSSAGRLTCASIASVQTIEPFATDCDGFSLPESLSPVTNLIFWGVSIGSVSNELRLAWPPDVSFVNEAIDIFSSTNLVSDAWSHIATVDIGNAQSNAVVRIVADEDQSGGASPARFYTAADQADGDGDHLSDAYERLVSGTSPAEADTDDDGLTDGEETTLGLSPLSVDSDADGLADAEEVGAVERLPVGSRPWYNMTNWSSIWPSTTQSDHDAFPINLPHPFVVNGKAYTNACVCTDGLIILIDPENPGLYYRTRLDSPPDLATYDLTGGHLAIAAFGADLRLDAPHKYSEGYCGSATVDGEPASVIDIYKLAFASDAETNGRYNISFQLVLPSNEENVFYLTCHSMLWPEDYAAKGPTLGVQYPELGPRLPGESFYHLTYSPTASDFSQQLTLKFTIGRGTDPLFPDSDGDGVSDGDEVHSFATDPVEADEDSDADGLPDEFEIRLGSSPFSQDTDLDGVDDFTEYFSGMNPCQPDSDGDGLDDGWELAYNGGRLQIGDDDGIAVEFDPTVDNTTDDVRENDPSADPDGDGLTNAEECEVGSNPCSRDTDGDGVEDGDEGRS